jgi:hypothetical protein
VDGTLLREDGGSVVVRDDAHTGELSARSSRDPNRIVRIASDTATWVGAGERAELLVGSSGSVLVVTHDEITHLTFVE